MKTVAVCDTLPDPMFLPKSHGFRSALGVEIKWSAFVKDIQETSKCFFYV